MSTLTKTLVILLSLFSIFLCGMVVIYVSSATNYKAEYVKVNDELRNSKRTNISIKKQLEEKKAQMEQMADELDNKMAALEIEKNELAQNLKNAERAKIALDEKVQNLAASALKFESTVGGMEKSLKQTRSELDDARAEGIKLTKNLNEITASLEEKMAQLDSLEAEKKRLLEEKANMESRDYTSGTSAVTFEPITQIPDDATPAFEVSTEASIDGVITAIDGSLVTVSIGAADGLTQGMILHVVRNDVFVCDIKINSVDAEAAAGTTQLIQSTPKVGDTVSTTW